MKSDLIKNVLFFLTVNTVVTTKMLEIYKGAYCTIIVLKMTKKQFVLSYNSEKIITGHKSSDIRRILRHN